MVIAKVPEFGNEKLNDHHFHYGYYIRAAAVLALADPGFLVQVRTQAASLVRDIANPDRSSGLFPYLRTFDVYEGHSWADGFAKFTDGNDEESSSEAINAWYGVYLWSRVTHDSQLESTALYLYATEVESTKEYWFGTAGLLTPPYGHRLASLVWGGKVDFGTWFSANPNAIYGIQLLPITPGSEYLGQLPAIDVYVSDLEAAGGRLDGYWGDLLLAWLSYYAPKEALSKAGGVASSQLSGPRSLLLYTLYRNLQLHP
jgi:endoglucanase Acf2